jgi:hypothetical protein
VLAPQQALILEFEEDSLLRVRKIDCPFPPIPSFLFRITEELPFSKKNVEGKNFLKKMSQKL